MRLSCISGQKRKGIEKRIHLFSHPQNRPKAPKGSLQNELRKNTADRSPKGFSIRGVCVKIESVKNNSKTQDQCNVYERNGQLVLALNNEILLPENAPVRLTSVQLEELDYRELYRAYSPKERKSKVDPRVLFKVMVYGYQCGIYSSRKLEEACRYRVDFMWLPEDILSHIFTVCKMQALTPFTITDPEKYRSVLTEVRKNGYAIDYQEPSIDGSCIAVPVRDKENTIIAALSFSGLIGVQDPNRLLKYIPALQDASNTITKSLYNAWGK